MLKKIIAEPFVYFLLIGAIVFALADIPDDTVFGGDEKIIHVDEGTLNWIHQNFQKQFKRAPTRPEMLALIDAHIVAEVKYREGLALKLDEGDTIVRRRMAQKIDFLYGGIADSIVPEKIVLKEWYQANLDLFTPPSLISFEHLFFSPDTYGNTLEKVVYSQLQRVRLDGGAVPAQAEGLSGQTGALSSPFPYGKSFTSISRPEVDRLFGHKFTEGIFSQSVGSWSGPVQSGYGLHLVRVLDVTTGKPPAFEAVIDDVTARWRQEENRRLFAQKVAALKANYQISVNPTVLDKLAL